MKCTAKSFLMHGNSHTTTHASLWNSVIPSLSVFFLIVFGRGCSLRCSDSIPSSKKA